MRWSVKILSGADGTPTDLYRTTTYLPDGPLAIYKSLSMGVFAGGSIFGAVKSQKSEEGLQMANGIDITKLEKR
jgi:hypothetical protein